MVRYTLVKELKSKRYPSKSKKYPKAHRSANLAALKKYGSGIAKRVTKVVLRTKEEEALGHHTKNGRIYISSKVPAKLRQAVAYHEKIEHEKMK